METPVTVEGYLDTWPAMILDANNAPVKPVDVCDAINNAAAGEWEKGRVLPDGKEKFDMILILYDSGGVVAAYWNQDLRRWFMGENGLCPPKTRINSFARVNIPKQPEAKK